MPDGAEYVGRAAPRVRSSRFANRHRVGMCKLCGTEHDRRQAVLAYAEDLDAAPELTDSARAELAGRDLACWCPEDAVCHVDVLRLVAAGVDPMAAAVAATSQRPGQPAAPGIAGAVDAIELSLVLAELPEPQDPRDGDCLAFEETVRARLLAGGQTARRVLVIGWLDAAGGVVGFLHRASLIGPESSTEPGGDSPAVIVDFTARQFARELPRRWYASVPDYRHRLAEATGLDVGVEELRT